MTLTRAQYLDILCRQQGKTRLAPSTEHRADEGSEADLHNAIIDECRRRGWVFFHGSMAERTSRTLGEPDFQIAGEGGRTWYVECKSRIGKLSPAQRNMKAHLEKLGHAYHVVRSFSEFLEVIK